MAFLGRALILPLRVITPWNYPHLCTVNSILPALLAGNAVIIKPAPQTPVPGERFLSTFLAAGLPANLLQVVHLSQEMTLGKLVTDSRIDFVAFTGSVVGGKAVSEAASKGKGFKGVGLELGGKDPAYVRSDANVDWTAEQLVDGMYVVACVLYSCKANSNPIYQQVPCSTQVNHVSEVP